jgi:predicted membrane channel-forming protein YqfA (hemolysin III family)
MKRISFISLIFVLISSASVFSQSSNDTTAYLLTCGPGTEAYSIYGHSALRIVIPEKHIDTVYNWGVFDFNAPNFVWKFSTGRLDYMVIGESLKGFLGSYFFEQRYVYSQRINIDAPEVRILIGLINENMKPENAKYRYDFFYDDCTTRIRDLLEKCIGERLKYPPEEKDKIPTFRDMVGKYQNPYPWYKFGVDLIMGSTADKKASSRDRMFLPIDMKEELSKTVVHRSGKMIPLLQNPVVLVDFESPVVKKRFLVSPPVVFTLAIILILILPALTKSRKTIRIIDIIIYSVFSALSVLMIFFNFFTDHQQMRLNLNIIWLNPFIIVCLILLILNKAGTIWFRIVFYISAGFLVLHFILPQGFNISFFLLAIILLIRSSVRCEFRWNPLNMQPPTP